MNKNRKIYLCDIFCVLTFFALASTVLAQPAMSRGEQLLSISYDECMRRAEQAFSSEGWVNIGKGGAYVNAFKESHGAYIMCNVAPEKKIWVNIVVASSSQNNFSGSERVKLQEQMGNPKSNQTASTTCWKWSVEMIDGSQHQSILKMFSDGRVTIDWGLSGTWRSEGVIYWIDWGRGAGKEDKMVLSGDTLSGKNFETNWIKGNRISCK